MKNKRKKGFTLIELIVTMAIFTILVAVTFTLITTLFKYNSINKTTFDANTNSRAFYEIIRVNRPDTTSTPPKYYPSSGSWIYMYFDTKLELENHINDSFVKGLDVSNTYFVEGGQLSSFDDIKTKGGSKKYCIEVSVIKNTSDGVFELSTRSWDLQKGNMSLVSRKSLISIK